MKNISLASPSIATRHHVRRLSLRGPLSGSASRTPLRKYSAPIQVEDRYKVRPHWTSPLPSRGCPDQACLLPGTNRAPYGLCNAARRDKPGDRHSASLQEFPGLSDRIEYVVHSPPQTLARKPMFQDSLACRNSMAPPAFL